MKEPWEIKTTDTREADTKPTFIIFCEDEVSEPIYFNYFQTENIKINTIPKQGNMMKHIFNAIDYCIDNELMPNGKEINALFESDIQVWCVFDRDKEGTPRQKIGDIDFDESIEVAKRKGFQVAWSNDAFELWVLLHFIDVDETDSEFIFRKKYYNELTEIFKTHPNPNSELQRLINLPNFNYKDFFKNHKKFRAFVRPEMLPNTLVAIERAKRLEAYHNTIPKANHLKSPCTLVHHLIEEIIRQGGKEIPNSPFPIPTNPPKTS